MHVLAKRFILAAGGAALLGLQGCGGGGDGQEADRSLVTREQLALLPATTTPTAVAAASLTTLSFTNSANYSFRQFTSSAAQNTVDANNNRIYIEHRVSSANGVVAKWGYGSSLPTRNADLHWNGSAWVNCQVNFQNVASQWDAAGNDNYSYCNGAETGQSRRASFDISGRSMAAVYAQILAGGYANLNIANPASALGAATFPANSFLYFQQGVPASEAIAYYPGDYTWPGYSDVIGQYSAQMAAGGAATSNAACNGPTPVTNTPTLEAMIAVNAGTPCTYGTGGSFTYNGIVYSLPNTTPNEWWGNSTLGLGAIGSAPVNSGTPTGYFTGNTLLRVAFAGTGTRPVTYYSCQQRFSDGSTRNCATIGTGTFTVTALGDGRTLTLSNLPVQTSALTFNRVFVERGGHIYSGYQNKLATSKEARLDLTAGKALLAQLGLTAEDPEVPVALTGGSYQGTYDLTSSANTFIEVILHADGTAACWNMASLSASQVPSTSCTLTITNAATGAFTFVNTVSGVTVTGSGTANFLTGAVTASDSSGLIWTGMRE